MHGLKTLTQLNELAAQNAPEAIAKALATEAPPSTNNAAIDSAIAERKAVREQQVSELAKLSIPELVQRVEALQLPTTLEEALARKLACFCHTDDDATGGLA